MFSSATIFSTFRPSAHSVFRTAMRPSSLNCSATEAYNGPVSLGCVPRDPGGVGPSGGSEGRGGVGDCEELMADCAAQVMSPHQPTAAAVLGE